MAGAILIMISARLRFSDLDGASNLELHRNHLRIIVLKTKTSGPAGKVTIKAANIQGPGIAIQTPNTLLESIRILTPISEPTA